MSFIGLTSARKLAFVTGKTQSSSIATVGAIKTQVENGSDEAFVSVFNFVSFPTSGSRYSHDIFMYSLVSLQWCTLFGGSSSDEGVSISYDTDKLIHVAGFVNNS